MERIDTDTGEVKNIPFLKYYTVFNAEQTENIDYSTAIPPNNHRPIERCERIINNMPNPPKILQQGNSAKYSPFMDTVAITAPGWFDRPEHFYATSFMS